MKTTAIGSMVLGATLALTTVYTVSVRAETTECTEITFIPTTINTQGVYCLKQAFGINPGLISGAAIFIAVNNVVLDFNGFKLGNLGAGTATTAIGIRGIDRKNVTIKNGILRGFETAISFEVTSSADYSTSSGNVVEDMTIDQNTVNGVWVEGTGHTVRRNKIVTTGGSTVMSPDAAIGIYGEGPNHRILGNDVIDVLSQGDQPVGISIRFADSSVASGNRITNEQKPTGGGFNSRGILVTNSSSVFVTRNLISQWQDGIVYTTPLSSGVYSGNTLSDVDSSYSGGTDAGDNFP